MSEGTDGRGGLLLSASADVRSPGDAIVFCQADDCWIAENRTADGKLTHDVSRFPHGMPWLIEQAHQRKLKLGLYAAASVQTCRQFPGSQGYEAVDAATFADWGKCYAWTSPIAKNHGSCGTNIGDSP